MPSTCRVIILKGASGLSAAELEHVEQFLRDEYDGDEIRWIAELAVLKGHIDVAEVITGHDNGGGPLAQYGQARGPLSRGECALHAIQQNVSHALERYRALKRS